MNINKRFINYVLCAIGMYTLSSCSPLVAEYTYRGSLSNKTAGGHQTVQLQFKEYEDGTISGTYETLKSSYRQAEAFRGASNSIRGTIRGNKINYELSKTQIGNSSASAKIATILDFGQDGHEKFSGTFSNGRNNLSGQFECKISKEISISKPRIQYGTFSLKKTYQKIYKGKPSRPKTGSSKSTKPTGVKTDDFTADEPSTQSSELGSQGWKED